MNIPAVKDLIDNRPNTFFNDFSFVDEKCRCVIIFFYCTWSPTIVQLRNLLHSLLEFPAIKLFILDIDKRETLKYMTENNLLSHAWGETYWVKDNQIVATLTNYKSGNLKELISNNRLLQSLD